MSKDKVSACVTFTDAARLSPRGRKEIALWLRRQADGLIREGDNYAPGFRARWFNAGVPAKMVHRNGNRGQRAK
jgi:hypothetical protein